MRNSPQTQHTGSAGQDAHAQLTLIPLPIAPGTWWLLRPGPLHTHPSRHRGGMMLPACTLTKFLHQLMQLVTMNSWCKGLHGMGRGQAPQICRLGVIWRLRIPPHHACTKPSPLPQPLAKCRVMSVHLTAPDWILGPLKWSCIRVIMIMVGMQVPSTMRTTKEQIRPWKN